MSVRVDRSTTLPGNGKRSTVARAVVRESSLDAGLPHLADDAVALVTELTAGNVIPDGITVQLQVKADDRGVAVTLSDRSRTLLSASAGGRTQLGLDGSSVVTLVDTISSAWGVVRDHRGTSVWFRLDAGEPFISTAGDLPAGALPTSSVQPAPAVRAPSPEQAASWLTFLPDELVREMGPASLVDELLRRLCETVAVPVGAVWVDDGNGASPRAAATFGLGADVVTPARLPGTDGTRMRAAELGPPTAALRAAGAEIALSVPLPVQPPAHGRLEVGAPQGHTFGPTDRMFALLSAERMAVTLDASRVRETEQRRRGDLTFLADASELLASSRDVDLTLALVAQLCVPRLGRWCVIHAVDDPDWPELVVAVHSDERAVPLLEATFLGADAAGPYQRIRQVVSDGVTVPLTGAASGIALPLTARRTVVGALTVGDPPGRRHTAEEIAIIADLARRSALAVDNARLYSERDEVAQALQGALLPPMLPQGGGAEFGAAYLPAGASTEVGGDFYDVLRLDTDRWMLAVGDVCGKGAEAASITGLARDVLRTLGREGREPWYALTALNMDLLDLGHRARFCTAAAATVERLGDRLVVTLCVAGHPLPVLISQRRPVEFIGVSGMAVGLATEIELTETAIALEPGEALVFYTDGVTERRRGTAQFGDDNLRELLAGCTGLPADEVADRVLDVVSGWGDEPSRDDIAVLVLRNASGSSSDR